VVKDPETVLLITHSGDFFTIDRVLAALLKRGVDAVRIDTDLFPSQIHLSAEFHRDRQPDFCLKYDDRQIESRSVKSVWLRRIWSPKMSENLAPEFQAACINESSITLDNFWDSLRHARWLDRLAAVNAAENKLRQLRIATEIGLSIPPTIVTNSADRLRDFHAQIGGRIVAKLLAPLSRSMTGGDFFMYTSEVQPEDLLAADALRHSPMAFQQLIPKLREFRVICVGDRTFVGALDASQYNDRTLDWRNSNDCEWQTHTLPDRLVKLLQEMLVKLELKFGAFDLIQTPDNEYVFLEVNPSGEWGMLERDLDYPIAASIAHTLVES
jgi:MvdC family ATP-grasp ribosomal peptide maturase